VRDQGAHAQDEARAAGGGDHEGAGGRWDIRVQSGEGDKAAKDNAACIQEEVREVVIHGGFLRAHTRGARTPLGVNSIGPSEVRALPVRRCRRAAWQT
jgi:hypothetical protein